ncbi:MAG TPA: zf-HC2 domain-containing protein [Methylophilaceae bacterium]|nr:zf-HC2 domain-containing protein [Methylophilaceae bacterium]
MLSCKQASQLLSQSLDRRLSWRERMGLRLHLTVCDVCRRFGRQILLMRQAIRSLVRAVEQDEQISIPVDVKGRIAKAIDSQHG